MLQLYLICIIAFCGSTMNGFDGSLMGSLLVMKPYQDQFGAQIVGVKAGYISAMMQIGGVCAIPFSGPVADIFGRRVGIFIGVSIIIVGVIVQGTSRQLGQYLAGRFLLGFGNTITSISGPSYVRTCRVISDIRLQKLLILPTVELLQASTTQCTQLGNSQQVLLSVKLICCQQIKPG